jgi:hypothetical protein
MTFHSRNEWEVGGKVAVVGKKVAVVAIVAALLMVEMAMSSFSQMVLFCAASETENMAETR